jgi:hypothetical protein
MEALGKNSIKGGGGQKFCDSPAHWTGQPISHMAKMTEIGKARLSGKIQLNQ